MDKVGIKNFRFEVKVGPDQWNRVVLQPCLLSLQVNLETHLSGLNDDLNATFDYTNVTNDVQSLKNHEYSSIQEFSRTVKNLLDQYEFEATLEFPSFLLNGSVVVSLKKLKYQIKNIDLMIKIGCYLFEQTAKQKISLMFETKNFSITNYLKLMELAESSNFKTMEALANNLCSLFEEKVRIRVQKPNALNDADYSFVEVKRRPGLIVLGIGSNLGERHQNISQALDELELEGIKVVKTSYLYETKPMYVLDQPDFLNICCTIETTLEPQSLLNVLHKIESKMKRKRVKRNGERNIDLDLIFYQNLSFETKDLIVPHPRIEERDFVLGPLMDLDPKLRHPVTCKTVKQMYLELNKEPKRVTIWKNKTYSQMVMGILNVTPDSFSDGNENFEPEQAFNSALKMIEDGADIIDIGGQSTRPGADEVTLEEELRRVIPVVLRLRNLVLISVDTTRLEVAKQAIHAGADMINDVSGGSKEMFQLCSQVNYCLMHNRGTPKTMDQMQNYKNVVKEVDIFLKNQELEATKFLRRWQIFLDPGLGFAKNKSQNFKLLQNIQKFRGNILVGPSRKRFLGLQNPKERDPRTKAICLWCLMQGVMVFRVHDVVGIK